jgi:general secretion pathway protein F
MGVRAKVLEGHSLADALGEFRNAFPELYRATVAAGEQSGHLDTVLERLADYTESREQLRSKTLTAMLLPTIQFIVCIMIVMVQLVYVVPKIVKQFENAKHELPLLTQMLIGFSNFMRHWGIWLLIALIIAGVMFKRWLKEPSALRRYQVFLLRVPVVGRVIRGGNTARFARTFSTLTASSVPVLDAMRIAGEVVTNLPMRDAVEAAAARVREGAPIAKSLGASRIFPPMMIHLIGSGEASGELEAMLDRAATNQERELDTLLTTVVDLVGPLMILVMGAIVMVIVLAMLLPIFQLNQLITA